VSALPEHVSAVTVDGAVDGTDTPTRRRSTDARRRLASAVDHVVVHPEVMRAIKAALRPGERLVIDHAEQVRTVYR
jgi:hypothetical protein